MFSRTLESEDLTRTGLSVIQAGQVHLYTLILLRWVAAAGQTATLLLVFFGLGFELPIIACFGAVFALISSNLVLVSRGRDRRRITEREVVLLLGFDVLQLSVLLYLTGGLANPFIILIIAPAMVSATVLSRGATIGLIVLAMVCISLLGLYHLPLPWQGSPIKLQPTYLLAIWTALAVAVVFITTYVWSVSEEARRMWEALAATQTSLAREQRVSALGGLAAAAAHELGSPLATITLVANELSKEIPANSPIAEDVQLLLSQSERCRDIITGLAQAPEAAASGPFERLPFSALVETARAPYKSNDVDISVKIKKKAIGDEPFLPYGPEMMHGLGNLVQNAVQFASSHVWLELDWNKETVWLTVRDDGPGFKTPVLAMIGEPFISSRSGTGENLGLGIFIAQTLLQHTGANLTFGNQNGGKVVISWARAILDTDIIDGEKK